MAGLHGDLQHGDHQGCGRQSGVGRGDHRQLGDGRAARLRARGRQHLGAAGHDDQGPGGLDVRLCEGDLPEPCRWAWFTSTRSSSPTRAIESASSWWTSTRPGWVTRNRSAMGPRDGAPRWHADPVRQQRAEWRRPQDRDGVWDCKDQGGYKGQNSPNCRSLPTVCSDGTRCWRAPGAASGSGAGTTCEPTRRSTGLCGGPSGFAGHGERADLRSPLGSARNHAVEFGAGTPAGVLPPAGVFVSPGFCLPLLFLLHDDSKLARPSPAAPERRRSRGPGLGRGSGRRGRSWASHLACHWGSDRRVGAVSGRRPGWRLPG